MLFGTYRYFLASLVVLTHFASWPASGSFAVFGFYMLSGFLMTMVLDQRYGSSVRGLGSFLANRALRIYPPYLAIVAVTAATLAWMPGYAASYHVALQLPDGWSGWARQILILGIQPHDASRMVTAAWSLHVELVFYLAMGLFLSRNRTVVGIWLAASIAYHVTLVLTGADWRDRYYPVAAASLPFSLGAAVYFYRDRLPGPAPRWAIAVGAVFLVHAVTARWVYSPESLRLVGFYVSLCLAVVVQSLLVNAGRAGAPDWLKRLDRFLGNLSYPVFLCHMIVSLVVCRILETDAPAYGITWLVASVIGTQLLAYGLHVGVEMRVDRMRDLIRERAGRPSPAQAGLAPAGARRSG